MHLFTFIQLRNPGLMFRIAILGCQSFVLTGFSLMYLLSSSTAHRFVGYLEEEAVKTYTNCIKELDEGKLQLWENLSAPADAVKYWGLSENAKFREVLVAIRADECMHREFNHHFADLDPDLPVAKKEIVFLDNCVGEAHREDIVRIEEPKKNLIN